MPKSKKEHVVQTDKFGSYSHTANFDKKTVILNSGGKIVAEEIYSRNKRFNAYSDLNKKKTTIYETVLRKSDKAASPKIGKMKMLWAMDGCFELLGLSDDGEHLIIGYPGGEALPPDYNKEKIMLSFFKRSKLQIGFPKNAIRA